MRWKRTVIMGENLMVGVLILAGASTVLRVAAG